MKCPKCKSGNVYRSIVLTISVPTTLHGSIDHKNTRVPYGDFHKWLTEEANSQEREYWCQTCGHSWDEDNRLRMEGHKRD